MKSIQSKIIILILLPFSVLLFAQKVNVPKKVKESFDKLYPNAKDIKWEEEGQEEFEVSFLNGSIHNSVMIDEEGEVEETETVIDIEELSDPFKEFLKINFLDLNITEATK